jgi:TRAP-type mannitol/chloroaromatic compound transport system substrate-binding protein
VFPAGTFVGAFEAFDAVGTGVADMYHATDYYWEKKSPAFNFFAAVPFGFTANELFAWVQYGGGQELWDARRPQQPAADVIGFYLCPGITSSNIGTRPGQCAATALRRFQSED